MNIRIYAYLASVFGFYACMDRSNAVINKAKEADSAGRPTVVQAPTENWVLLDQNENWLSDAGSNGLESETQTQYLNLLRWFATDVQKMQTLFVNKGIWQTVTAKFGTEFTINTLDFEEVEKATGSLHLKVMELMDKASMIQSGVQTLSLGRPLECLAAVYVALSDGKRNFRLKQGSTIWVKYPQRNPGKYGVFYSHLDHFGRMISESSKQLLQTNRRLKRDGFYEEIYFTADSSHVKSTQLFRLKGTKLLWQRHTTHMNGVEITDTLDYQHFTQTIFNAMGLHTRSFLIPIGKKMVPLENINGTCINYKEGKSASILELHYTLGGMQNLNEFTVEETRAAELNQTGWIQFSRFLPVSQVAEVNFESADSGNISAGLIYLIFKKTNTILMQPWLAEGKKLPPGKFLQIPKGTEALLLAVIRKDNMYFTGRLDCKAGSLAKSVIHFEPMQPGFDLMAETLLP